VLLSTTDSNQKSPPILKSQKTITISLPLLALFSIYV